MKTRKLIIAFLLALPLSGVLAAGPASENDLKAAYLMNILKFVQRKEPPADRATLMLCLGAAGPLAGTLQTFEGNLLGGRKLKIRVLPKDDDLRACEAVYLGRTSGQQATLARAVQLGLLTVGNDAAFISSAGMLSLIVEGRKVVLEVNSDAAKSADWTFSSHLLEICRLVRPGSTR